MEGSRYIISLMGDFQYKIKIPFTTSVGKNTYYSPHFTGGARGGSFLLLLHRFTRYADTEFLENLTVNL